jgi:adenosylcobyric acid synthase
MADLDWLRAQGLASAIQALAARGVAIVGICGGYQMLGQVIRDPDRVEASVAHTRGLGLLPIETVFEPIKATHQIEARILQGPGWLSALTGETIRGYEIHMGQTTSCHPWLRLTRRSGTAVGVADGTVAADGQVWGCYVHGLFDNEPLRRAWLSALGWQQTTLTTPAISSLEAAIDHLADAVEASLDMAQLEAMIWAA